MAKILLCLMGGLATAVVLLQLRQEHLNLTFQTNELHNQIQATQAQLWNQQLNIAVCTAPNAIAANLKGQDLKLANPTVKSPKRLWIEDLDAQANAEE
ncbi:MAG: hypothetical protein ABR964_05405 [Tepidisphaeraceae bacterium]